MSKAELVFMDNKGHEPFTTSDIIAEHTKNSYRSIQRIIENQFVRLEQFGIMRFEITLSGKAGRPKKVYQLNEAQATLLITFLKNTDVVADFKVELVRQFFAMRTELLRRRELRAIGKPIRRSLTDAINIFTKDLTFRNSNSIMILWNSKSEVIKCLHAQVAPKQRIQNQTTLKSGWMIKQPNGLTSIARPTELPAPKLYDKAYTYFWGKKNKRVAGDSLATDPTTHSTNAQGIVYPLEADKSILSDLPGVSQGGDYIHETNGQYPEDRQVHQGYPDAAGAEQPLPAGPRGSDYHRAELPGQCLRLRAAGFHFRSGQRLPGREIGGEAGKEDGEMNILQDIKTAVKWTSGAPKVLEPLQKTRNQIMTLEEIETIMRDTDLAIFPIVGDCMERAGIMPGGRVAVDFTRFPAPPRYKSKGGDGSEDACMCYAVYSGQRQPAVMVKAYTGVWGSWQMVGTRYDLTKGKHRMNCTFEAVRIFGAVFASWDADGKLLWERDLSSFPERLGTTPTIGGELSDPMPIRRK